MPTALSSPSSSGRQTPGKDRTLYHYLIVASGVVFTGIPGALIYSCAGIFFGPVSDYFEVPTASVSAYFSVINIAMMIMLPIAGNLMNKFDLRIVLTVCTLLCGFGLMAMSALNHVWQFYIAGAVLGIGLPALLYLAVPALINSWFHIRVGFFVGLCMAFTGIGGAIFNPIGKAIITSGHDGWRKAYLIFGIIILVVTLPFTIFVVRGKPQDKGLLPFGINQAKAEAAEAAAKSGQAAKSLEPHGVTASKAMRTAAFIAMAGFCGLVNLNQIIYQFISKYADSFEPTIPAIAAISGFVVAVAMVGSAIAKVMLGSVNDKSIVGGLTMGLGVGVIGVALLWIFPAFSSFGLQVVFIMAGAFLFGFPYACPTVQTPILVRRVFGNKDYTNIYSRVTMVGTLASAVAAYMWGVIVDLHHGYSIMFTLSIILMAAAWLVGYWGLKQKPKMDRLAE